MREALRTGTIRLNDFHAQLLRVVYRLIFLFVVEDRILDGQPLLHPRDGSEAARIARDRYAAHYGVGRLRELAGRIKGSRHGDMWRQFQVLVGALSGDPHFEPTRRALTLPALGSFLWDPDTTSALNDAKLTNYDFLESLRRLAFIRQGKVLRPVDYRNLGAEELGGVYESLLGLTPQLDGDGACFTFAEFAGNVRQTTGSYYTPDELVQCLLDSALDPVIEAAIRGKAGAAAERAILNLNVCDPAVGSGHFLVGAAHRIARHLARVRAHAAGDGEPSPLLYQHALRDVIGHCLYGVDVNPMAAELCRVSLWLEALEPGKPLSFLDRHIRVGNSLVGATPELLEAGLPDAAFKRIQGDDQEVCSAVRQRNKAERETGQRDMRATMAGEPRPLYEGVAHVSRDIDEASDGTLDDVRRKEVQFRGLVVSPAYRRHQRVADAWCAAFVWPKGPGANPEVCITTDVLKELQADPDVLSSAQSQELARLARRYQFFHWELQFPEVFAESAGFDCVLGNPPWERIKIEAKAWFAHRCARIAGASTAAERKRMIDLLQVDDPLLHVDFMDALRGSAGQRHLIRSTGRYPLCAHGDIDLYTVFAELMRKLLNERGRIGCVLPTGIATDNTTRLFFQNVVRTKSLISLLDFENHQERFFSDVRSDKKFCLFTAARGDGPVAHQPDFVFFARTMKDAADPDRRFTLSADDIALLNPNTRNCPIFRTRSEAALGKAIFLRVPVLIRDDVDGSSPASNPWGVRLRTMFHMANDSAIFRSRTDLEAAGWSLSGNVFRRIDEEYLPLYEGKMIQQFDHHWATWENGECHDLTDTEKQRSVSTVVPRHWVPAREVYLRTANLPKGLLDALRRRDSRAILFGVAHRLFAQWMLDRFAGSAEAGSQAIFRTWLEFVARHPFAGSVDMVGMVSRMDTPGIQPLDETYVPAVAVDDLARDEFDIEELARAPWWRKERVRDSGAVWYPVDGDRVARLLEFAADTRYVPQPEDPLHDAPAAEAYAEELLKQTSPRWLIGVRDVTSNTDSRTVIGTVFPFAAVGHKLPVWMASDEDACVFPALFSSLACDFAARLKIGGKSLAFFVAKQIPVLAPAVLRRRARWLATMGSENTIRAWLLPRILELTYTTDDLESFARQCGWNGPPFRWDVDRRFLLRCELDAAFFHLYLPTDAQGDWTPARRMEGCPHDETAAEVAELREHFARPRDAVEYIMDSFRALCARESKSYGEYRLKRVVLETYDALQEAIASGTSYRTILEPAPADPACCHLPSGTLREVVVPPLVDLPDGAWVNPAPDDHTDHEIVILAAVLKAVGGPVPIRRVRLAALLAMEPRLFTSSLPARDAAEWGRLTGSDAAPLPATVSRLRRPAYAWGAAVRQLRGTGDLVEDLKGQTWARGTGLDAIDTGGWPEGRVSVVLNVLNRRGDDVILRSLPAEVRAWIDEAA